MKNKTYSFTEKLPGLFRLLVIAILCLSLFAVLPARPAAAQAAGFDPSAYTIPGADSTVRRVIRRRSNEIGARRPTFGTNCPGLRHVRSQWHPVQSGPKAGLWDREHPGGQGAIRPEDYGAR